MSVSNISSLTCLVTGSSGFIGRNLVTALNRRSDINVLTHTSVDPSESLETKIHQAEIVYHLAGANRPAEEADFARVNTDLTAQIADILSKKTVPTKVVYSSSIQAEKDNPYGQSKLGGENALIALVDRTPHPPNHLPIAKRIWQVVTPQLQHRCGNILPQHCTRNADQSFQPGT